MAQVTITDESAALLHELWEGMRDQHGEDRTEAELVDDAIWRVHRGFFGRPPGEGGPDQPTGPFFKWASGRGAEVLLRQIDAKTFRLAQPFRYDDGTRRINVPEDDVTDLASVPRFLTWLIPRYGRHTLAALVHDHLQDVEDVTSEEADLIFRDSMGDIGVPLSRRWLMWSAVGLRTEKNHGGWRLVRAIGWAVVFAAAALVLSGALVWGALTGWGELGAAVVAVAGVMAAALVLSVVWGRLWRLGALTALGLVFFTLPILLVLIALGGYLALEWMVEHVFVRASHRNPVLVRNL